MPAAIKMIEDQAQSSNLTDRIKEFIEKRIPQDEEEEYDDEGDE